MRLEGSQKRSTFKGDHILAFHSAKVLSIMADCRQYFGIFIVDM